MSMQPNPYALVTLTDGADQTRRRSRYENKSHHHPREVEGRRHVAQQEHFPVSQTLHARTYIDWGGRI